MKLSSKPIPKATIVAGKIKQSLNVGYLPGNKTKVSALKDKGSDQTKQTGIHKHSTTYSIARIMCLSH
jgi:hypothetical protein